MHTNPAKWFSKVQLAWLAAGTGLAASIHFGVRLIPVYDSFFSYAGILYFLAGLVFGILVPGLSWKGDIWLTVPWIVRTFLVIAGTGFKDGILGSIGWLLIYSLPLIPAVAGAYAGTRAVRLISFIRKR